MKILLFGTSVIEMIYGYGLARAGDAPVGRLIISQIETSQHEHS